MAIPLPGKLRRPLHIIAWNALFLIAGIFLIGGAAEAYLRLTKPFMQISQPTIFHPEVGLIWQPGAEVRRTNRLDFWQVTPVNRLGFLDREPITPEQAAASCHITIIGDSFVEGRQVPIPDKMQVQLETLAAERLPHRNVVTSAFGISGTGQINQLGYYDEFARPLTPKMVALVFVPNDFANNFPLWSAVRKGLPPQHSPFITAALGTDGSIELRPPSANYRDFALQTESDWSEPWYINLIGKMPNRLYLSRWVNAKLTYMTREQKKAYHLNAHAKLLAQLPEYAQLLADYTYVSPNTSSFSNMIARNDLPEFYDTALSYTAFALDAFQERAERDNFSLVILTTHLTRFFGDGVFLKINEMAQQRGIPVIDQAEYVHRQGRQLEQLHWQHDYHWNPQGHRYAAEALLEYLEQNQEICGSPP